MLTGTCHCGEVSWKLDRLPKSATACNCTICRCYGAMWAYGPLGEAVTTVGQTRSYLRQDGGDIAFHFCAKCGCTTHFIATSVDASGSKLAAVNLRLSDPLLVGDLPIRHFEGHESFKELPSDGRSVKDLWF